MTIGWNPVVLHCIFSSRILSMVLTTTSPVFLLSSVLLPNIERCKLITTYHSSWWHLPCRYATWFLFHVQRSEEKDCFSLFFWNWFAVGLSPLQSSLLNSPGRAEDVWKKDWLQTLALLSMLWSYSVKMVGASSLRLHHKKTLWCSFSHCFLRSPQSGRERTLSQGPSCSSISGSSRKEVRDNCKNPRKQEVRTGSHALHPIDVRTAHPQWGTHLYLLEDTLTRIAHRTALHSRSERGCSSIGRELLSIFQLQFHYAELSGWE